MSVKRMVERICESRAAAAPAVAQPPFAPPQPPTGAPPPAPAATTTSGSRGKPQATPAASTPRTPTDVEPEYVAIDELVMHLPHHLFGWKDVDDNERMTLLDFLPTGCAKDDVAPRIVGGGTEVVVEFLWPAALLDQRLPMFAGTIDGSPFYDIGHVKVSSFREFAPQEEQGECSGQVRFPLRATSYG
jgi:hypothetical protein